jgi:hypothetical protein
MTPTTKKNKRQNIIEHNDMKQYLDDNKGWRTQVQIDNKASREALHHARMVIAMGAGMGAL